MTDLLQSESQGILLSAFEWSYKSDLPFSIFLSKVIVESEKGDFFKFSSQRFTSEKPKDENPEENFLLTESIFIHISPQKCTINILENYPGWQPYYNTLKQLVSLLLEVDPHITTNRLLLKSARLFENLSPSDFTNFQFTFGIPTIKSNRFVFQTEFKHNDLQFVLKIEYGNFNIWKIFGVRDEKIAKGSITDITIFKIFNLRKFTEDEFLELASMIKEQEEYVLNSLINKSV